MNSQAQSWIEKQIKRIGIGAGTGQDWLSRAVIVMQEGNDFLLYNDFSSAVLSWEDWQEILRSLPDGAGHLAFWNHPLVLNAPGEFYVEDEELTA